MLTSNNRSSMVPYGPKVVSCMTCLGPNKWLPRGPLNTLHDSIPSCDGPNRLLRIKECVCSRLMPSMLIPPVHSQQLILTKIGICQNSVPPSVHIRIGFMDVHPANSIIGIIAILEYHTLIIAYTIIIQNP